MDLSTRLGVSISDLQLLKSMNPEALKAVGINLEELEKAITMDLEKAKRDGLVPVKKVVTRGGKQITTTVYVKPDQAKASTDKAPAQKKEPDKKDSKPASSMSKEESKSKVKELKEKYGTHGLIEIAEKNGLKWSRNDKFHHHDYMRMAMAMSKHFQEGGTIKHGDELKSKSEPKKQADAPKKATPKAKAEPKKAAPKADANDTRKLQNAMKLMMGSGKVNKNEVLQQLKTEYLNDNGDYQLWKIPRSKQEEMVNALASSIQKFPPKTFKELQEKVQDIRNEYHATKGNSRVNGVNQAAPADTAKKDVKPTVPAKKDTKAKASSDKKITAKELHNSVWSSNDPSEGEMHVQKTKNGFYMHNNKFDADAKTADEAILKLKKWGYTYLGKK